MAPDYDAVVVGARVAGATTAALLGDAGHRVLLVDRAHFPSDTLSTHFFRGARAVAVLERLGVLADVLALGAPPLVRQYSYRDGGAEPAVQPPQEPGTTGYALSVRRGPLDHLLAPGGRRARRGAAGGDAARRVALGGRARRRCAAAHPHGRADGAGAGTGGRGRAALGRRPRGGRGVRGPGPAASRPVLRVRARLRRAARGRPRRAGVLTVGQRDGVRVPLRRGPDLRGALGRSGGISPPARWRLGRFRERLAAHRGLAARFAAATIEGRLLGTGPEPSYVRVPSGPGWALVGDAGMHQDPWGGQGIDMGTTHAAALAEALDAWLGGRASEAEALAEYHRRRNDPGMALYQFVTRVGRDLRALDQAPAQAT